MKGKKLLFRGEVRLMYPVQGAGYVDGAIILYLDKDEVLDITPETIEACCEETPPQGEIDYADLGEEPATDDWLRNNVAPHGSNITFIGRTDGPYLKLWLPEKEDGGCSQVDTGCPQAESQTARRSTSHPC